MVHYEESLIADDGLQLNVYRWIPENSTAAMVVSHGWSEHAGRYHEVAKWFALHGIEVHALDHRGHGKSEGPRGHVLNWKDYVDDLEALRRTVNHDFQYALGHSMGGMITVLHMLEYPDSFRAVALSGPAANVSYPVPKLKKLVAGMMSRWFPTLKFTNDVAPEIVCGDPDVVSAYANDPYNHGVVTARWFCDYLKQVERVKASASSIKTPIAIWHGEKDALVEPWVGRDLYDLLSCEGKKFELVEGALHEILFEKEWTKLAHDIKAWLELH